MHSLFTKSLTGFLLCTIFLLHTASGRTPSGGGHDPQRKGRGPVEGLIGVTPESPIDNPADNIFHVRLKQALKGNEQAYLVYDLDGVEDHTAVSRSVNDQLSAGGYLVKKRKGWARQKERISIAWLKAGDNVIRFTLPEGAAYSYRVRNVSLEIGPAVANEALVISQPSTQAYYQDKGYIKGYVPGGRNVRVRVGGREARVWKGAFEAIVDKPAHISGKWQTEVEVMHPGGASSRQTVQFVHAVQPDYEYNLVKGVGHTQKMVSPAGAGSVSLGGAAISIPAGALNHTAAISITALRPVDLPALDAGMVNVTREGSGYRFLPHGTTFKKEAKLELAYDESKIPEGYTTKDIRTYYFDEQTHHWVALPQDTVLEAGSKVVSRTGHFTDMINAIIKVPESPEVQAYNSTSMKGIKAANPTAGINLIDPPQGNNTGSASVGYPLSLPAGRGGMQPQLTINYSSGGANGWLGLGWNLSTPSITIDTRWGVPRFDAGKETETYSFNGEQLAPVAHRDELVNRTAEKLFYPRVEGSYHKIIRHGDHPANYWWEVTDKSGTKYFYGGDPAGGADQATTLADETENKAYWALKEVRDLNGNFVRYHYTKVEDAGVTGGTVKGYQLYVSKITYTGYDGLEGKYAVVFTRDRQLGESRRADVSIAASLGFKQVTADLLRKIDVQFEGKNIRSYELKYQPGEFLKTLLVSIEEYDAGGKLFNTHKFDYHNDVRVGGTLQPFRAQESWSPGSDDVHGKFINPLNAFNDNASALSGTSSKDFSVGMSVNVGFDPDISTKSFSVGGNFGYSQSVSEGLLSLMDLNGDGLADKVFVKGDRVMYRRNLGDNSFGAEHPILSAPGNFFKEKSKTVSGGVEAHGPRVLPLFAGAGISQTTSTTTAYLTEVNGDQLPDIVVNGKVYFNHINASGDPEFTLSSGDTPSPIFQGGSIATDILTPDPQELEKATDQNPLHDVVRMWQAPFAGTITITAPVRLIESSDPTRQETPADGVRVAVQVKGSELWSKAIGANDYTEHAPTGLHGITVQKGDRVYFRVQSIFNGSYDQVNWEPVIYYEGKDLSLTDANGQPQYRFSLTEDFLVTALQEVAAPIRGKVRIESVFHKPVTSDTIRIEVRRKTQVSAGNFVTAIVWSKLYAPETAIDDPVQLEFDVDSTQAYSFHVVAATNVDWPRLQWAPRMYYTASYSSSYPQIKDKDGNPLIEFRPVPEYSLFSRQLQLSLPFAADGSRARVRVTPVLTAGTTHSGSVVFTVKKQNQLLHKQYLQVQTGGVLNGTTQEFAVTPGEKLFFEYHTASPTLAASITKAVVDIDSVDSQFPAGLYTVYHEEKDVIFGPLYRHWGHFAYNGNRGRAALPIDESLLKLSDALKNQPEVEVTEEMSGEDLEQTTVYNPAKETFVVMVPMAISKTGNTSEKEQVWGGYDNLTYAGRSAVSSSRMGDDDLNASQPNAGGGSGASAINKITKTFNRSYSIGGSVGPVGGGYTHSEGDMKVLTDFMDMNGDRYPDIVTDKQVQYTTARGGFSEKRMNHGSQGNHQTLTKSDGFSISGSYVLSKTEGTASNPKKVTVSIGSGQSSIGLSGNFGNGSSHTGFTWTDINGDGLPDKVFQDGKAALNLGYSLASPEPWGFDKIQDGESKSEGGGLGISIVNGSINAGISLSRSDNNVNQALQDVNGDGLVDVVIKGSPLMVKLNKGNGFGPAIAWTGATQINQSSSSSESVNVAFTAGIYIPLINIKITVTPSTSVGQGVTRDLEKFADMNGDGYPDYVRSTKDDNLSVQRSTIGRTNLLKSVERPMGASFVLDYQRTGNTYQMPNDVWTLSSVKVFDGFKGDGPDTLMTTYTYEDGFYDRHEREFYGFKKVATHTHNTGENNIVYTTLTQTFSNGDFYTKGLVLEEVLQSADGKKFTKKENIYQLKDRIAGFDLPESFKRSDGGSAFVALVETQQLFYEGQPVAGKSTRITYGYDTKGNINRFTDYGDEGTEDDIRADIIYHFLSDKYIAASPKSIVVTGGGKTYRRREATLDEQTGDIKQIRQFMDADQVAVHDMEYDGYGNLKKVIRPSNAKGQRLTMEYEFDKTVHSYVTKVSNSYGYYSETSYDFRFGQVVSSKDLNGHEITYELDEAGRVTKVTGPYEKASNAGYSIKFEYHPEAQVPWALTRHFDPAHPNNDLLTSTFTDGLGRVLQTKKDVALYQGEGAADKEQMVVSGRVLFDGLGRAVSAYYPVTENTGSAGTFNQAFDGVAPILTTYDVLSRVLRITLPDGSITEKSYGFGNDRAGKKQFSTKVTDANGKHTEHFTDVRGQVKAVKNHTAGGPVWASFVYNALSEQLEVTDDQGHTTITEYDMLGRKTSRRHPDAGLTTYGYDAAGNLTRLVTANLQKDSSAVLYSYDFERLAEITYPHNPENNVLYTYGEMGAEHNRAGRIVVQEDGSGAQEFFYGPLGELVKSTRTIVIPQHDEQTYATEWTYDTWNRMTSMTYPDGEKVTYTYNTGGLLQSMSGKKKAEQYNYVTQLGYDKFEQRVFLSYGNGTKTTYSYEPERRRLKNMTAKTAAGRVMMDNEYGYDKVNNILSLTNNAPIPASNLMGGASAYVYEYDDLYRLTEASGSFKSSNDEHRYSMEMEYNTVGGITRKIQLHDRKTGGSWITQKKTTYDLEYTYEAEQPHAPVHIGEKAYAYDANGNQTGWTHDVSGQRRRMLWDEENRLRAVYDNGAVNHYIYDAAGERVLKGQSTGQTIYVNGEHKGGSGSMGNFTVYVNAYTVLRSGGYTKHYYIEGQRIVSKLGGGWDNEGKGPLKPAGDNIDFKAKQQKVFDGIVKNLKFLGADGQILTAGKSGKVPPGQINGTGNAGGSASETFRYYYHPDHLGSTAYVTDASGEVYQHLEYFAFGETFVEEHSNTHRTPYLFNGKELDEETGLYYYGARYYDPRTSVWQSVDPKAGKFPNWSPYNYAFNNPVKLIDPNGEIPILPLILKAGANAAADWFAQTAMNYYFNPETAGNLSASAGDVNGWQIARSGLEGLIPWKTPGGRLGRAALTAVGDVTVNYLNDMSGYSTEQAVKDFAVGFIGDLAGGGLGDLVSKYGASSVAKGLGRMGFDYGAITRMMGGGVRAINKTINGVTSTRMVQGWAQGKVAVIGRNMDRVRAFANGAGAEVWNGFDPNLSQAENLANNKKWIQGLKDQGYTIYDVGLDPKYASKGDLRKGDYYGMESREVFGDK